MANIFSNIPDQIPDEIFEDIVTTNTVRIERILSYGHSSPESSWYDQAENEWVIVLEGQGVIQFENGKTVTLNQGDYLNIPARQKHRVASTAEDTRTIWLAVFYG